jgi:hypothetical protein
MNKTHHIRINRNGQQIEMRLRVWARENQHLFPNFGFTNSQDDHPITHQIKEFCITNLNAQIDENDSRVIVII